MKRVKKFLTVLLCVFFVTSLAGCGGSTPDEALSEYLDTLKAFDIEAMEEDGDAIVKSLNELDSSLNLEKGKSKELFKQILSNLSYEIISTDEKEDNATVKVKITNKDLSKAFDGIFKDVLKYALSNPNASEKDMTEFLSKKFTASIEKALKTDKTVTNEINVNLQKEDGEWVVKDEDKDFDNAIFGNLYKAFDNFEKELN